MEPNPDVRAGKRTDPPGSSANPPPSPPASPPDPPLVPLPGVEAPDTTADDDALPERLKTLLIGKPRDLRDKSIYHAVSLAALLAWVGLGADGLSSSSYGPAE